MTDLKDIPIGPLTVGVVIRGSSVPIWTEFHDYGEGIECATAANHPALRAIFQAVCVKPMDEPPPHHVSAGIRSA